MKHGRLIDADALEEKVEHDYHHKKINRYDRDLLLHYLDVEMAPTIEPEPKWIPCSERLPDSPKQVLVYARSVHYALAKYDEMRETDGSYKKQWVTFDAWKPFYTIKEIIAWMPLPEPYKERRKNEK